MMDSVELAKLVVIAASDSETWADLREEIDALASQVPQDDDGGLSGWNPTRIEVDWLEREIDPEDRLRLIDNASRAIRKAETTEAAIRSVLRIVARGARLAGAA